jgi:hypothetical protein
MPHLPVGTRRCNSSKKFWTNMTSDHEGKNLPRIPTESQSRVKFTGMDGEDPSHPTLKPVLDAVSWLISKGSLCLFAFSCAAIIRPPK